MQRWQSIICSKCDYQSDSLDKEEYGLELPLQSLQGVRVLSVEKSISQLLTPEILNGANQYSCPQCGEKRDASRCLALRQLPDVLPVIIDRGVFDGATTEFIKDDGLFEFDLKLDMRQYTGNDADVYDLCSVISHQGDIYEGKYQAVIRDMLDEVYINEPQGEQRR